MESFVHQIVSFAAGRPPGSPLEFRVGVGIVPPLADHGFQDMVVLPGSFYIDMALYVDRETSGTASRVVRNATFENPVILSTDDTVLRVEARERGDGRVEYTFYEATGVDTDAARYAARLEVDRTAVPPRLPTEDLSVEAVQVAADAAFDAAQFYGGLRENGNQYGPAFQGIASVWRAGNRTLGRFTPPPRGDTGFHRSRTRLLDSMTQLLAPAMATAGKTFILRSIERIDVADADAPDALWGHATAVSNREGGERDNEQDVRGTVRAFDASGTVYAELSGVTFALLDAARGPDGGAAEATRLVIASNFTAEPLEDSLRFWGDHFDAPLDIEFAPYNQVYQQLLDAGSAFHRNVDGINVVVLGLEEWATDGRRPLPRPGTDRVERALGARARHVLPNGLEIAHLNKYETEYLYHEIFGDRAYLRHGIHLRDGDTVVDIGANIGMFSLFVMSQCADPTIYAFEPAPLTHDLLQANCAAYGTNARAFRLGVSDRRKSATFTFYEKSSVFSSFHSDEAEDREAIEAVVRNMLRGEAVDTDSMEEFVAELTADRLNRKTYECELTSVSDIIRDNGIERIDLLKIDAEKSELDIIRGIADEDWPKIRQMVLEIHDRTGEAVRQTEALLVARGFHCAVVEETLLHSSGLYNLYATRGGAAAEATPGADAMGAVRRNIADFGTALRAFMQGISTPLVLCIAPRSPQAEGDAAMREAFADAEQELLATARSLTNVHCIGSEALRTCYALGDYYDPHGHQTAHIPYTPEGYAALGTAVVRALFTLRRSPYKVIVLDCDNTLWGGVCGEDGVAGVQLTAGHRALQEFMVEQMRAGMLLCLCSKNNEQDVFDVLDQRADMPLKREHLAAWQVNWKSKSQNIRALASQLGLGQDSFVFLDDNPVECADVRANCPDVTTLQVPSDPAVFPSFLAHVWAFDRTGSTREDRSRTRMYQENARRERAREESLSLADFVKGLDLRVDIGAPAAADIPRVSQLTFRTNQFNFTTVRRSEREIHEFLDRNDTGGLAIRVADRFGDYGLVGVVLYAHEEDRLRVDTFLLSCRVLGRGVEHAIVAWLGREAAAAGKRSVVIPYAPTARNQPALEFITAVAEEYRDASSASWTIPADRLARAAYDPERHAAAVALASEAERPATGTPPAAFGAVRRSERLQRIGDALTDAGRIAAAIAAHRAHSHAQSATSGTGSETAPATSLEASVADIWSRVLGRPRVGLHENFFEVGGTSLRAVQVIAAIKKELHHSLSIVALFESPTVALLAARLGAAGEGRTEVGAVAAAARGQQRRYNTTRRKAR